MCNAKYNLRQMKIQAWNNYLTSVPCSEQADFYYDLYLIFAENYDFM